MVEALRHLRWQDILDIIVVALVLYRVLLIINGTRAVQMLIGLGVLLGAFFLSSYLKLHTMYWIIQSLWAQVVLALIILFQPEIRKALAQMGETSFLPSLTSASELKSLEEIVRATVALSSRKIGALIVIERDISLKDFIEIGTPLDAKVSKEILLSIFHPSSPMHDGSHYKDRQDSGSRMFSAHNLQDRHKPFPGHETPGCNRYNRRDRCRCHNYFRGDRHDLLCR